MEAIKLTMRYHCIEIDKRALQDQLLCLLLDQLGLRIHTKRRNRLEHQRLNDLVYVHYNLRLQNSKRPYDPVDYECIDKAEFWIVEKTHEGELDYDELEEMLEEEVPRNDEESSFDPLTDEINDAEPISKVDLDQFGLQSSTYYSDNEKEDD
ncbi:UNVERIFIED_CONTAM: hypothetical protein Slati_1421800 [Sesamum latifolium]|uniref:Uncharacterized protein n=1 Tax=Sesamum latifolium TaxID=2727402 RepID=A0AAW2X3F0_9LAMI